MWLRKRKNVINVLLIMVKNNLQFRAITRKLRKMVCFFPCSSLVVVYCIVYLLHFFTSQIRLKRNYEKTTTYQNNGRWRRIVSQYLRMTSHFLVHCFALRKNVITHQPGFGRRHPTTVFVMFIFYQTKLCLSTWHKQVVKFEVIFLLGELAYKRSTFQVNQRHKLKVKVLQVCSRI